MQEHKALTLWVKPARNVLGKRGQPEAHSRVVEAKGHAVADQITEGKRGYYGLYHIIDCMAGGNFICWMARRKPMLNWHRSQMYG